MKTAKTTATTDADKRCKTPSHKMPNLAVNSGNDESPVEDLKSNLPPSQGGGIVGFAAVTLDADNARRVDGRVGHAQSEPLLFAGRLPEYLTTREAAAYLRKSVSWLLRVPDMTVLRGKPNLYAKTDLDTWVERHKFRPRVKA